MRAICVDDGISKKINLYYRSLKLIHIRAHFPSNFSSIAVELNLKSDRGARLVTVGVTGKSDIHFLDLFLLRSN